MKKKSPREGEQSSMWKLNDAQQFISGIQSDAFVQGFNLSLGGGVLNNGRSDHDLDIMATPAKGVDSYPEGLVSNVIFRFSKVSKIKIWNPRMLLFVSTYRTKTIDWFVVVPDVNTVKIAVPVKWIIPNYEP